MTGERRTRPWWPHAPELRAGDDLSDATAEVKAALAVMARRVALLDGEIATADGRLAQLVTAAAPTMMKLTGIGPDHAGQLLATVGANPLRLRGGTAFAHLCGVARIPAASERPAGTGCTGAETAKPTRALRRAVVVRMRYCQRTRAYVARRSAEGLSKPDVMRCLKRYLARE
jgi:transposase